jgi:putative tryptophan/tyrosine transport system substrate-binding protein
MIPIVFFTAYPVAFGLVASLSRPGGNLTGFSILSRELTLKRLELLSELVPQAGVIALLVNPNNPGAEPTIRSVLEAAGAKGVASYPEGRHRKRDRRRLHFPLPTDAGALVISD